MLILSVCYSVMLWFPVGSIEVCSSKDRLGIRPEWNHLNVQFLNQVSSIRRNRVFSPWFCLICFSLVRERDLWLA